MKEPWLTNIAWPKYLGFLANVAMIIGLLESAPIPEKYRTWARFVSFFVTSSVAFLLNPKPKRWISDEQADAEAQAALLPSSSPPPAPAPTATLTNEQMALIAEILQRGQRP